LRLGVKSSDFAFPVTTMNLASAAFTLVISLALGSAVATGDEFPVTGDSRPELEGFDAWMKSFMAEHKIPGGSLAIVRDGKVIYARGFGYADREAKQPVEPEALFRIASVSKPITAVAILKLVEQGKLKLDDKVLDHLKFEPHFDDDGKFDERWNRVTIAHCLSHIGGWDRDKSYDPMFQALRMARSLKVELPILPEHIIRYQLGQPLDFEPGERYAYSNFGYSLLGRVIERVTHQTYERYVQEAVFKPLGITRARIGGSLLDQRAEGEVRYYDVKDGSGTAIVGPGAGEGKVAISYGTWRQETLDSHGGWIASAEDLARFAAAFDLNQNGDQPRSNLLQADSIRLMFKPVVKMTLAPGSTVKGDRFYSLGWMIEPGAKPEEFTARHGGALACTAASLMYFSNGVNLAVLTNLGQTSDGKFLGRQLEPPLTELVHKLLP
jgi:N-acyl-D-amino-acid deacylase